MTTRLNRTEHSFEDWDVTNISHSLVILDLDGTLAHHGAIEVADAVQAKIHTLIANGNAVRLVSNNSDTARSKLLAEKLGIEYRETNYRKPNVRALGLKPGEIERPIVVVGDKALTDGLFAKKLGAQFIKVSSMRGPHDRLIIRTHYLLDRLIQRLYKTFVHRYE